MLINELYDLIIAGNTTDDEFRKRLHDEFNSEKLNMQVNQTDEGITISKSHYNKKITEFDT